MSRRKRTKNWIGIAHSRIPHDVTDCSAWRVLSFSAKALYTDMRAKLRSTNNGNINATLSEMKHRGWSSSATLSRSLRQLECMGFIDKTRQGGIAYYSKVCSLYRFTDLEVYEHPKQGISEMKATHDYQKFGSVREAEAAIREIKNNSKLQKMKLLASESEPIASFKASETEQEASQKLQKPNKEKLAQLVAKTGNSGE